jgi:23S rRNA (uridine2479-2'-O)-methyltransferase
MSKKIIKISKENNTYQYLEVLKNNRYKRFHHKKFFVEGVRNINLMLQNQWQVDSIIYSEEGKLSSWAIDVIKNNSSSNQYVLSKELMKKLSDKENTSEILIIAHMRENHLNTIKLNPNLIVTILDRPSSPGNLGAIIRSGDAFGANGIIISDHSVDIYDPLTIRASTGSFFSIPIVRLESFDELNKWLRTIKSLFPDFKIIGADEEGENNVSTANLNIPLAFIFGNEKKGLSIRFKEISDMLIKIPMVGSASSLNISCAAYMKLIGSVCSHYILYLSINF